MVWRDNHLALLLSLSLLVALSLDLSLSLTGCVAEQCTEQACQSSAQNRRARTAHRSGVPERRTEQACQNSAAPIEESKQTDNSEDPHQPDSRKRTVAAGTSDYQEPPIYNPDSLFTRFSAVITQPLLHCLCLIPALCLKCQRSVSLPRRRNQSHSTGQ